MAMDKFTVRNTSNEVPTETQKRETLSMISKAQQDIRSIDEEISQFQSIVDDLRLKRKLKVGRIAKLKTIISCIKDLPFDILSMIFVHCSRGDDHKRGPPWRLGHICVKWRRVALATPDLWNHIVVKSTPGYPHCIPIRPEMMETLFLRAGEAISCVIENTHYLTPGMVDFLPLLARNTHRLRYLALQEIDCNSRSILELPAGSLNTLEELHLCYHLENINLVPDSTLLKSMPSLRRVSIAARSPSCHLNPLLLDLPWPQLTHLNICEYVKLPFIPTHTLLSRCANLVACSLRIPDDDHGIGEMSHIVLRDLASLTIDNYNGCHIHRFLQCLILPSLKRLNLSITIMQPNLDTADILGIITRSGCAIEAFKVPSCVSADSLISHLGEMPSLRRLWVGGIERFPLIMQRMLEGEFLPNLKFLEHPAQWIGQCADVVMDVPGRSHTTEPLKRNVANLNIAFVVGKPVGFKRRELQWMRDLKRKWPSVSFRVEEDKHFMDDFDGEEFGLPGGHLVDIDDQMPEEDSDLDSDSYLDSNSY